MKKYPEILFFFLVAVSGLLLNGCTEKITKNENKNIRQTENTFRSIHYDIESINYLLYLPKDYDEQEKLPMLLFLHGAGSKGDNLKLLKFSAIPKMIEDGKDFPFIIVSPQCQKMSQWTFETTILEELINRICDKYKVDENRIYVTGLSMGGFGTWALAMKYPKKFAAVIPICGGGDASRACNIGKLPVWTFHGTKDNVIPISETQALVDELKSCGGNVQFTVYPDGYHNVWDKTYNNNKIYDWFLSHTK